MYLLAVQQFCPSRTFVCVSFPFSFSLLQKEQNYFVLCLHEVPVLSMNRDSLISSCWIGGGVPQEFIFYFFFAPHRNGGHIPGQTFSGMFPMRVRHNMYRSLKQTTSTRSSVIKVYKIINHKIVGLIPDLKKGWTRLGRQRERADSMGF